MKKIKTGKLRILKSEDIKNLLPGELLVFHVTNQRALAVARQLPDMIRKNTLLISTLPSFRFEDKSAFLEVVEVHSPHPELGAFAAEAINRAKETVSVLEY